VPVAAGLKTSDAQM